MGRDRLLRVGGDGTVHEVVNGLANSDADLGVVPCGRGNDLARALGLSRDVKDVVNTLVHGVDRAIDLGKAGDRFFATVASLGFDTAVAQRMRSRPSRLGGTVSYGLAICERYLAIDLLLCVCGEILAFSKGVFCWRQRQTRLFMGVGSKMPRCRG